MHKKKVLFALSLLIPLSSCEKKSESRPETKALEKSSTEVIDAMPTEPKVETQPPAATRPAAAELGFTKEKFGLFDGSKELTTENGSELFPGLLVKAETISLEGDDYPIIVAYRGDEKMFTTMDGKSLTIVSSAIKGPDGLAIGAKLAAIKVQLGKLSCHGGVEDGGDTITCSGPNWDHLTVGFLIGQSDYYDKKVPADKIDKVLAGKTVSELTWSPVK